MMSVFWEMVSRNLVIIRFLPIIYQLVLYIFTNGRNNISEVSWQPQIWLFNTMNMVLQYFKLRSFHYRLKILIYSWVVKNLFWVSIITFSTFKYIYLALYTRDTRNIKDTFNCEVAVRTTIKTITFQSPPQTNE